MMVTPEARRATCQSLGASWFCKHFCPHPSPSLI
jgi:hypothetical protein